MRIALVYDAVYPYVTGGAERRYHAIAAAARAEHHVALYGLGYWRRDPPDGAADRRLARCTYVAVAPPMPLYTRGGRRSLLEPFVFAAGLVRALRRSREDVWDVASFPYVSVPVARLVSVLKRRPLVVTWLEFWGDYWYEYLGAAGVIGKLLERLALRCSPRIVAISEFTKRRLISAGAAPDRITVVPSGVDIARIAAARPEDGASEVIYVGRLLAHKQVDLLIRALPRLRDVRSGSRLAVVGDGPERRNLERLAAELGVREAVRFTGQLDSPDRVYGFLKASRVLVLPSRREGFGTVVLEAWACGIPVVVCDEPENAAVDLVDEPLKGRVVPSDPLAMAGACAELLDAVPDRPSRLKAAAARYDWSVITAGVLRVYSASLQGSRRT